MQSYAQLAETYLRYSRPEKYAELKDSGLLEHFVKKVGKEYDAHEYAIVLQVTPDMPDNEAERARRLAQAKMMAREIVTNRLVKYLEEME